ncbi:MAG: PQQ-binding-like beta-propeller repeat protein [Candidatus Marinimicrobia bacterium]|nr:PQQ-binding-like beta-propeller repeat protein [Candidatus Neomarinimicrobiota bacterium]MCF7850682.1 PQQ-binding-like beta-propeller repeat protein [Candidatus Neomarinimicrobiota bacterium]MCF7905565.1 PQQ-binding-like beta-propeller repeat protein [Candidatus Neomarinimicrobiota bacterium]
MSMLQKVFIFALAISVYCQEDASRQPELIFAWMSDTHIGSQTAANDLNSVVDDINRATHIDFAIVSGDITETDTHDNLEQAKVILDRLDIPYYIIPGNHDTKWSSAGGARFSALWGDDRFNVEIGDYRFIGVHQGPMLRMGDGYIDPDDIAWVDSILHALEDPQQKIFIVQHYPLDPSVDNWYAFRDVLDGYNIQAVLNGHHHRNFATSYEGIPGIMGRSTLHRQNQPSGYTLAKLYPDHMDLFERIPSADSLNHWYTLDIGERNNSDSLRLPKPDYSHNQSSGVVMSWQQAMGSIITASTTSYKNLIIAGSTGGKVQAFDRETGAIAWTWSSPGAVHSTPAVKGNRVILGTTDSTVICLAAATGKMKWQTRVAEPLLGSPRIHKNRIYIGGGDGTLYALALRNGRLKWKNQSADNYIETLPVIADKTVMFGAWDGAFYGVNIKTGDLEWKWSDGRPGDLYSPAACWPVTSNGKVFVVAPDRAMTAIDVNTGNTVWRKTGHSVREMIGISADGDQVLARTMTDSVFGVSAAGNAYAESWIVDAGYGRDFAPSMMMEKDGKTFFGTKDGWIYCMATSDGELLWKYRVSDGLVNTVLPLDDNQLVTTAADGNVSLLKF